MPFEWACRNCPMTSAPKVYKTEGQAWYQAYRHHGKHSIYTRPVVVHDAK